MNIKHPFKPIAMGAFLLWFVFLTACSNILPEATPTPAPKIVATTDPYTSVKVVQAFWDALAAGNKDKALMYVGDKITCAAFCHFTGKDLFASYLQGYLDAGYLTKISNLKGVGSIVTYGWEVYRNGNFVRRGEEDEMMQVEDGKIIYWENYHR